ncbi:MAG: glycosyltransferase [Acidiferrobacterales bacterium]
MPTNARLQPAENNTANRFVFHVLGMSFTATSRRYLGDAHTQNIYNLCQLLMSLGHTVYHYGNHGSDVPCTEHADLLDRETMEALYRGNDLKKAANGYFAKETPALNREFVRRAVSEIGKRKAPGQFLLGVRDPHEEIARHHADLLFAHHSVGHVGWSPKMTVYASEFVRNFRLSKEHSRTGDASAWTCSAVIPHFLYPGDFEPCYDPGDYFLYLGRLTPDKGVQLAIDVCARQRVKLFLAGQGDISHFRLGPQTEYLGFLDDMQARNDLLRKAKAVLVPTQMPEPFGMVVIEAMMSGVPVISSDWGAFPEINRQGVTGYRCTAFSEYLAALRSIDRISRQKCREVAEHRFSDMRAGQLYGNYFERMHDLQLNGPDSTQRSQIDPFAISH